jgi:hypothetical protein
MGATGPTAGATFAATQIFGEPPEMIRPSLGFLRNRHIADPFVPGEWRQCVPTLCDVSMCRKECVQIRWHSMKRSRFFYSISHK